MDEVEEKRGEMTKSGVKSDKTTGERGLILSLQHIYSL